MLRIKRNNLIHEMHDKGISAYAIAAKLNVYPKTIYNIIKKKHTPSVELAQSIANLFGIKIEELFEFEEE
ncbi:MAG: helix-turn-helix transcriptional regulator [Bacteroidales bacterium]|nr:helix-turn-helix transcriptional regulator [Bacteroidales bacterium]